MLGFTGCYVALAYTLALREEMAVDHHKRSVV